MGRNSQLYKRASRSGSSDSVRPHRKTLRARVVACCSLLEYDRVFRRTFRGRTSPFGGSRHAAHPLGPGYGTTKRHTNAPPRPSTPGTHQRHGSGPVLSLAVPAHHCSGGPDTRRILWDPGMVQRSGTRMHRHVPPHPEPINATGQARHAAHHLRPGYGTTKRRTNASPRPSTPGTHQRHGSGPRTELSGSYYVPTGVRSSPIQSRGYLRPIGIRRRRFTIAMIPRTISLFGIQRNRPFCTDARPNPATTVVEDHSRAPALPRRADRCPPRGAFG